jgi:TetR/AcrR family transcriptional regulator, fatty acid metabolism regulator protein
VVYHTTPKMAKRKEAHRAKFLQTAIHLFGSKGYHATTVPDIVREAGSSTGAFYFYFRNKEDVFASVLEFVGEQIAAVLNKAIAGAGENAISQMRVAVETFIVYLAAHPDEARVLIVESSGLTPRLGNVRRAIIASHCRSVEGALASSPRPMTRAVRTVVASCWVGAVHEAVYQWLHTPQRERIKAEILAQEVSSFNLRGIGAEKEPS